MSTSGAGPSFRFRGIESNVVRVGKIGHRGGSHTAISSSRQSPAAGGPEVTWFELEGPFGSNGWLTKAVCLAKQSRTRAAARRHYGSFWSIRISHFPTTMWSARFDQSRSGVKIGSSAGPRSVPSMPPSRIPLSSAASSTALTRGNISWTYCREWIRTRLGESTN